jgi:putative Ca2+/H+ antiporter (TMEM165/GDT1 family)
VISSLFLVTTALTAAAEVGDKSQLMSLLLGMRFRRPAVVIGGILVATLTNHLLAAFGGRWLGGSIDPTLLRWGLALLFMAMALWTALPDKFSADSMLRIGRGGVVLAPTVSFFLSELGDKSELGIATLAARYDGIASVVVGGAVGMMLINVPLVLFGVRAGRWVAQPKLRYAAAFGFAMLALFSALDLHRS